MIKTNSALTKSCIKEINNTLAQLTRKGTGLSITSFKLNLINLFILTPAAKNHYEKGGNSQTNR